MRKQAEEQTLQAKGRRFFDREAKLTNDLYAFLAQKQGGEWHFDHEKYRPFDPGIGPYREGAGNYPEMLNLCVRINNSDGTTVSNLGEIQKLTWVTREYTCEHSELLEEMLLDSGVEYIPTTDIESEEGVAVISRIDRLDGLLGNLPAERRERLGLDEIQLSMDLADYV